MQTRTLGKDLQVSAVGLGCMGFSHAYGAPIESGEAVRLLRRANAVCPVTAVQNRYSMMARQYEALFPTLEELGVGLVAFSPMANGFLTGSYGKDSRFDPKTDYRAGMPQFAPGAIDQNQPLLDLLRRMAQEKQATPAQISLAWMLCKKPWIVPIPGTRKEARMAENAGAAGVALTPRRWPLWTRPWTGWRCPASLA